jgi:predicted RNase H-like nuclease
VIGQDERVLAVGVDACRGGWVAVLLADGAWAAARAAERLDEIAAAWPAAAAIGVDMPLGLLARGWRQADDLAAARLGRQRSRVFRVPPRPAMAPATHRAAVAVCRELTDPPAGFSIQAWGLRDKITEADVIRARTPGLLAEVHPELSFAALNGGAPVGASKKTWSGQMTRRALLAAAGIVIPDDLADAPPADAPPAGATPADRAWDQAGHRAAGLADARAVPPDDLLDAAAVAWTATRIARGQATPIPAVPQLDDADQPITIWF